MKYKERTREEQGFDQEVQGGIRRKKEVKGGNRRKKEVQGGNRRKKEEQGESKEGARMKKEEQGGIGRKKEEEGASKEEESRGYFCEKEKYCRATSCILIARQHLCPTQRSLISIYIDNYTIPYLFFSCPEQLNR